jgi:poly(beta-D-mannuronate) lyase
MRPLITLSLCSLLFLIGLSPAFAEKRTLVSTPKAFKAVVKKLQPGDTLVLAKGVWRDFEIVFKAEGEAESPITLEAEVPGEVILSGRSNLRLAGSHLIARGLVFRDGYSPSGEVISFRRNKEDLAHHSRVTEMVIDHYSLPDRAETDYWVALYGRHNRFDHNHLVGKTNAGVTLAVRLDGKNSRQNYHRIDHNYFGPRPVLGSNGGETLRIGTSEYSMFESNTTVEQNYFDRCNGEVEIISNKSGANIFRANVFFESQGTLTLRHGDGNTVEDNVFFGNGQPHTGGIRVINRRQVVRNNYLEGLRGSGFASALTVMSGVPNSPVNRYVQVSEALIEHNSVIDSRIVGLGTGRDAERSAAPIDSEFRDNLLQGPNSEELLSIEGDVSGIQFSGNIVGLRRIPADLPGFEKRDLQLVRAANGLLYAEGADGAGASRTLKPVTKDDSGVSWYPKPGPDLAFDDGLPTQVLPGDDTLSAAVAAAVDGATLQLAAGDYVINQILAVDKTLSLRGPVVDAAAEDSKRAIVRFTRSTLFELRSGARLRLSNLTVDGGDAPDAVGNALIRTSALPAAVVADLELSQVQVRKLRVNAAFNVIALSKGSVIERVRISHSEFRDLSGAVVEAMSENDDYGRYNVDDLLIEGSTFHDLDGPLAAIYRGGTDESTFGPRVVVRDCSLGSVGGGKRNRTGASLLLHGVQMASISGNRFQGSAPIRVVHTVGEPQTLISNNQFLHTPAPELSELNFPGAPRMRLEGNETPDQSP